MLRLARADTSMNSVSPPVLLSHQAVLGELLWRTFGRVRVFLVDLVYTADHDRHLAAWRG